MEIKNENYYTISGWMINELGLSGTELQVYAIVYGFSQDGQSWFSGSLEYLASWTGTSKRTVLRALDSLTDSGYLIKDENYIANNIKAPKYQAVRQSIKDKAVDKNVPCTNVTGGDKMSPGTSGCHGGGDKMSPNIIDNNIYNNIHPSSIHKDIYTAREEEPGNLSTKISTDLSTELSTLPTDEDRFIELWNRKGMEPLEGTGRQRKAIRKAIDEFGLDGIIKALTKGSRDSRYLSGRLNGKPMDLGWFLQNFGKILNGEYDDRLRI